MAPPDFGRSVNPISTRGTDYAHLITTGTPGFSDLPTALYLNIVPYFVDITFFNNVYWKFIRIDLFENICQASHNDNPIKRPKQNSLLIENKQLK